MNQNLAPKQDSLPPHNLSGGKTDFLAALLDAIFIILEHWKLLVAGPLIAGAVAYASSFLLQKSYQSYAYLGPLDEGTGKKTSMLILSPMVLDAALRKLPRPPFSSMTTDEGRLYLTQRIHFALIKGGDP